MCIICAECDVCDGVSPRNSKPDIDLVVMMAGLGSQSPEFKPY